jgi:hypothetical protein
LSFFAFPSDCSVVSIAVDTIISLQALLSAKSWLIQFSRSAWMQTGPVIAVQVPLWGREGRSFLLFWMEDVLEDLEVSRGAVGAPRTSMVWLKASDVSGSLCCGAVHCKEV